MYVLEAHIAPTIPITHFQRRRTTEDNELETD